MRSVLSVANRIRIQYASDLHLEFDWIKSKSLSTILKPCAPFLVLAGDIGSPVKSSYKEFLTECSKQWEHVFVVAGNHERYGGIPVEKCREIIDTIAEKNIHFMNRDRIDIDSIPVSFLGCTLWSDISGADNKERIRTGMNDCRSIGCTPEDILEWYYQDKKWLEEELARCREEGRGAVVITHHLPTYEVIAEKWKGHPLTVGFASHLDYLITEPVRAWICGHSHTASTLYMQGPKVPIPVTLNPRGYPGEFRTGFSPEIFVDVCTSWGDGESEIDPELAASATEKQKDKKESNENNYEIVFL